MQCMQLAHLSAAAPTLLGPFVRTLVVCPSFCVLRRTNGFQTDRERHNTHTHHTQVGTTIIPHNRSLHTIRILVLIIYSAEMNLIVLSKKKLSKGCV